MAKHKDREFSQALFQRVCQITTPPPDQATFAVSAVAPAGELRKMKQFRFQLLHRWLTAHFSPCRVADIAGGKGLLAYLLQQSGWQAVVIDPVSQALPPKYKDIGSGSRVRLSPDATVPRINAGFAGPMAQHYDLLVGMHAHGCNVAVIDAAAAYGSGFVLLPCCVIDEPFYPRGHALAGKPGSVCGQPGPHRLPVSPQLQGAEHRPLRAWQMPDAVN